MVKHLRLVGDLIAPWLKLENNQSICSGIQCNLMKYLARSFNFSYEIIGVKDGPGYQLPNGSWTGMIGKILSNVSLSSSKIIIYKQAIFNLIDGGYDGLSI